MSTVGDCVVNIPHAHRKWLDFGETRIDWQEWEGAYEMSRWNRAKRYATDEPLLVLLEAVAYHLAVTGSFHGGVELQLITSGMIREDTPEKYSDWIDEMIRYTRVPYDSLKFGQILSEVRRRVVEKDDPVLLHTSLCYEIGTVMGLFQKPDV